MFILLTREMGAEFKSISILHKPIGVGTREHVIFISQDLMHSALWQLEESLFFWPKRNAP